MLKKMVALLTTACIAVTMAAPVFAEARNRSGLTAGSSAGTLVIHAPENQTLGRSEMSKVVDVTVTDGDSGEGITDATISVNSDNKSLVTAEIVGSGYQVELTKIAIPATDMSTTITLEASKVGYETSSASFTVTVKSNAPISDEELVNAAREEIEKISFTATQAEVSTEAAAKAKAERVMNALPQVSDNEISVTAEILNSSGNKGFKAPIAGTEANQSGTDGFYNFKALIEKAGAVSKTTDPLTMTITATAYTPAPEEQVTVSFYTNGAAAIPSQTFDKNGTVTKPADPTKNGFTFAGWYTDAGCAQAFDFATPVTKDITLYAKWTEDIQTPDTYTVTVSSAMGGRGSASPAQAKKGESVSVTAVSASGYEFDFWSANPVVDFADRFAARTTFTMIDENVTVIPHFKKVDSSFSSPSEEVSSSSSWGKDKDSKNDNVFGDGSGAYGYLIGSGHKKIEDTVSTLTLDMAEKAIKPVVSEAKNEGGAANWTVNFKNIATVGPDSFKVINTKWLELSDEGDMNLTIQIDTVVNGVITARLYIDPKAAAKLDAPIFTNVDTSEKSATNIEVSKLFDKYFRNDVKVVTFGQKGEFGMPVPVAVKVNLKDYNVKDPVVENSAKDPVVEDSVKNPVFYNYDVEKNSYRLIENPEYFIDNAGYVHFTTEKGGSVIIADSALQTK